jgi:predicted transcriptional regulator
MNRKHLGINQKTLSKPEKTKTYPVPNWVPNNVSTEKELCPDCFKVVGERSRYNLVCMLGQTKDGMTVGELTEKMKLQQPTVTHHLQVLQSVNAVASESIGRNRIYKLNRDAHCFEDCKIPY